MYIFEFYFVSVLLSATVMVAFSGFCFKVFFVVVRVFFVIVDN